MADNSEQKIIRGKQAIDAVKAKKNAILDEINNIRQALRVLKGDVENFHEKCNVARTVGTTTSVVGAGLTIGNLNTQHSFFFKTYIDVFLCIIYMKHQ